MKFNLIHIFNQQKHLTVLANYNQNYKTCFFFKLLLVVTIRKLAVKCHAFVVSDKEYKI